MWFRGTVQNTAVPCGFRELNSCTTEARRTQRSRKEKKQTGRWREFAPRRGEMLTGRLITVRSFHEPEGGGIAGAMRGRDYGVCVFLGDEGKFGLATRPAKLYSTSSALLRLLG